VDPEAHRRLARGRRVIANDERTVKNIIHDVTSRMDLRNRTHAVAYALREGLI
jgi:DNA-binding NarL/FixJ family response regulator